MTKKLSEDPLDKIHELDPNATTLAEFMDALVEAYEEVPSSAVRIGFSSPNGKEYAIFFQADDDEDNVDDYGEAYDTSPTLQ